MTLAGRAGGPSGEPQEVSSNVLDAAVVRGASMGVLEKVFGEVPATDDTLTWFAAWMTATADVAFAVTAVPLAPSGLASGKPYSQGIDHR